LNNQYNVWNKWDKLKTVVLGDLYRPEFYDGIKTKEIRDGMLRITEESMEDLAGFEKVLKDFGCDVIRPEIDPNANIMDFITDSNTIKGIIPKPSLMPRDAQFVSGNTLVYTNEESTPYIYNCLKQYNDIDIVHIKPHNGQESRLTWAPFFTGVGKDMYVDILEHPILDHEVAKLMHATPDIRLNYLRVGGHNDGCFHTIKEGAIISLHEIQHYSNTFPGWDVLYLPNQSWDKIDSFIKLKRLNKGKWWVPGEEDNDHLTFFIEAWLSDWVGYVEESVFDVNVLVLDEHHVCVSNMNNPDINAFLKKHKMEPVHVPWRHRYFWDGGLHCLTLDLYREGIQKDYFPERQDVGVIDHGFDPNISALPAP
tara:strand:- start:108 stop:1208 length:1101 start_codon:yes stop_codon:yes gene_type:complete